MSMIVVDDLLLLHVVVVSTEWAVRCLPTPFGAGPLASPVGPSLMSGCGDGVLAAASVRFSFEVSQGGGACIWRAEQFLCGRFLGGIRYLGRKS